MRLFAREAFLPSGWAPDVALEIAPDGTILRVDAGTTPRDAEVVPGPVLPGMPNAHSHAFQRAIAGKAERRADDFWSWREAMYRLAGELQPDGLYELARRVYEAMLRAGYTAVAEFHYLHRDPSGAWYADKAAMARSLVEAAHDAGIAICLLPALYAHGDAGGVPLSPRQARFAAEPEDVLAIVATLCGAYANDRDVTIGVCAHSLRAVMPAELRALLNGAPPDVPVHLHVAEQLREIEVVREALGTTPVAWLLANHDVGARWTLVHATHLTADESDALARSGAIVALCPTTEANLGDGIFPLERFLQAGGGFAIGSDSNVSISPVEELRWLEYGQRLAAQRRIIAAIGTGASCGESLYAGAARGGARACGFRTGALEPGARADLLVLEPEPFGDSAPDEILDRYVFATDRAAPRDVMVGGRWRVRDGALTGAR